ncbi:uncharacterized protein LOC116505089 isoform X1 [Thamnophis elegans]|uniref:uncharacterized protein LOC116505089 isoform X1 n=1 Tax=Thamnophis elegans TaxID=35005 RepID=UPI0013790C11|nr:uncharacterized protein LOC116505089 isoform X1 [Thamnophis elegans]
MGRGESAPKAEEKTLLAAMPSPWLLLMLVGPAAGLVLSTPSFPVSVSHGKTALLPVSLNFSSSVPAYFQIRWRFIPGQWLVLIVKADNCQADNGTHQWWDACEITVAEAERYRHRAEWSSEDTSLILRDARVEDSGIYNIKVLALGVRVSANINLTVINETSNPLLNGAAFDDQRRGISSSKSTNVAAAPVPLVKAEFGRDYTMTNIIRLSLAGLILCLLGFIIAENVASRPRETRVHQMEIPFSSSPVEQCFLTCENHPS